MAEYPIELTIVNSATKESKKFHMKQCNAWEDDSLIEQLKKPDGKPNDKEIWIARLSRDFQEIDEAYVRKMPRWERETLLLQWMKYNDVDTSSFLEEQKSIGKESKETTS